MINGCGRAASAGGAVTVHIVHLWTSDLVVTLVAPDGTAYVLRNRVGAVPGNIDQTYSVNLSSEPADGVWRLRVDDVESTVSGSLTSWSAHALTAAAPGAPT